MSDAPPQHNLSPRQEADPRREISADDALPPVEPPSAGFLLQLFVVPGLIVGAIVMAAMLITWMARSQDDPHKYLQALRTPGPGRWQAAGNLANALRDGRHEDFKRDPEAAAHMGRILEEEIESGSMKSRDVELRQFLSKALGEMQVDQGIDALIRAASTQRRPEEAIVRRWAIESIATLAENLSQRDPPQKIVHPDLTSVLIKLSHDQAVEVRIAAAVALASVGGDQGLERLEGMLNDPAPAVRHNAAIRLAKQGRRAAIAVLEEILDPVRHAELIEQQERLRPEGIEPEQWRYRLETIRELSIVNALKAALALSEQVPPSELASLRKAIASLVELESDARLRKAAQDVLTELETASPQ